MEKKLYYKLEDNGDLSCTCESIKICTDIMEGDILDVHPNERGDVIYTITPIYLTEEEYNSLPEWLG